MGGHCCRSEHLLMFSLMGSLLLLWLSMFTISGAEAYKNYTVGDKLGWFDDLQTPEINYQKWVDGKNFSLGDFLIFNTDKNHSVIQTYNLTTYKQCDYYDATDATTEWSTAQPAVDNTPVTVAVPLLKEGTTYFFSGNYDGEQCQHGQHFEIDVSHGAGLPPDLKSQYSSSGGGDSPGPSASTPGADDQSTPDTVIPSNFDEPTDNGKAKAASTSAAVVGGGGGLGPVGLVVVVGWAWMVW
ncbi:hypothetical protein QJS10_CPB17g01686 [Acorus calamus]|uniref:Phytocyanin domain-containing protein n=1 Tax=Acorus calamus TaxID=4465 RepID=A0AAV9CXN7_ACOCL|nr:hypothetical protein QJS10_CPB17g01686 [Acorus calamus]